MTTKYNSQMEDSIVQTDAIPLPSRENEHTDAVHLHSGENEPTEITLTLKQHYALQEQYQDTGVTVKSDDKEPEDGLNNTEMPSIAAVPPDFLFNKLLMDIENSISRDELEKLKSMLKGNGLLGKRVLQEIESASDLFGLMRQRCFISCEDIVWLQAILQVLRRPELIERTIEYSRLLGNVIYFSEASEQPENGFRYVKFHVKGRDFSKCTRRYIEGLRTTVARLVSVPAQFVMIAGVEPSSSFMVTFMIPELYVRLLEQRLQTTTNTIEELIELDIDTLMIGKHIYDISDMVIKTTVYTEQQMQFVNVYKQLKIKSKQLEDREIECMQLRKQLKNINGTQKGHGDAMKFKERVHISDTDIVAF